MPGRWRTLSFLVSPRVGRCAQTAHGSERKEDLGSPAKDNKLKGQPVSTIGDRKADHIALCSTDAVAFKSKSTLFEAVRIVHNALPELSADEVDPSISLFGRRLRAPIFIAAMTGGTEHASRINRELSAIAADRGYGFGLGSQRPILRDAAVAPTFDVRKTNGSPNAKNLLLLGNLGMVQAVELGVDGLRALVDRVEADALCIHLNPAMELVQPGGDRDFRGGLALFETLVASLGVPVIAKETGCGLSRSVAKRLKNVGVSHVDVSGAGGTSWVGVETKRAEEVGDQPSAALGALLWDWGVPTAASVMDVASVGFETIIATGGVMNGVDVAKALLLGATAAGLARPVLMALQQGGRAGAEAFLDQVEAELRAVMLLTGSRDLAALRGAEKIVVGELAAWHSRPHHA